MKARGRRKRQIAPCSLGQRIELVWVDLTLQAACNGREANSVNYRKAMANNGFDIETNVVVWKNFTCKHENGLPEGSS